MSPNNEQHEKRTHNNAREKNGYKHPERISGVLVLLATAACVIGYMLSLDPRHKRKAIGAFFIAWVLIGLAIAIPLWLQNDGEVKSPLPQPSSPPNPSKSRFSEKKENFIVRLGGVNVLLNEKNQWKSVLKIGNIDFLTAQIVDGKVVVDTQLFDAKIKLVGGDLYDRPPQWDSNSDDTALEIVNEKGQPMFQIEYLNDQLAVAYGFFCVGGDCIFAFPDNSSPTGGFITPIHENEIGEHRLEPIFKYPSGRHHGERVNP